MGAFRVCCRLLCKKKNEHYHDHPPSYSITAVITLSYIHHVVISCNQLFLFDHGITSNIRFNGSIISVRSATGVYLIRGRGEHHHNQIRGGGVVFNSRWRGLVAMNYARWSVNGLRRCDTSPGKDKGRVSHPTGRQ